MLLNRKIPQSINKIYSYDSTGAIFHGIFNSIIMAFTPIIMRKLGATDFIMGVITIAPIAGSIVIFLWLRLAFKYEKIQFVAVMKSIGMLVLFIPLLFSEPIIFAVCFLVYNIFERGCSPAYVGIMKSIYPTKFRAFAMGMVRIEATITAVIISLIAGRLFDRFDFRILFFIGICAGLMAQFFFYRIRTISPVKQVLLDPAKFKIIELITILKKDKLIMTYFSIFFIGGFGNLLSHTLYPIYLVDVLHVSYATLGILFGLSNIALIIGFYFWGKYIDKYDPLKCRTWLFLFFGLFPLFYLLTSIFKVGSIFFLILAYISRGITLSGAELARINIFTRIVKEHDIEKYWTIDFFLVGVRGIIAPVLGLFLKNQFGFRIVFFLGFSMLIITGFRMWNFYTKNYDALCKRGLTEK